MVGLTYRVNIYPGSQKNIKMIVPCAGVCEIAHFVKIKLVQMYANLGNSWRPVPEVTSNDRKFVALIQVKDLQTKCPDANVWGISLIVVCCLGW